MALTSFLLEGADGAVPTAAAIGANQIIRNGGILQYAAGSKITGATGIRVENVANQQALARFLQGSNKQYAALIPMRLDAAVTHTLQILTFRYASGAAFRVGLNPARQVQTFNAANAAIATSSAALTVGTYYYIGVVLTVGVGTTDGVLQLDIFEAGGTTPVISMPASGINLGTAAIVGIDIGFVSQPPGLNKLSFDDLQLNDGGTTIPAQLSSSPVVTGSSNLQVTISLDGSAGTVGRGTSDIALTTALSGAGGSVATTSAALALGVALAGVGQSVARSTAALALATALGDVAASVARGASALALSAALLAAGRTTASGTSDLDLEVQLATVGEETATTSSEIEVSVDLTASGSAVARARAALAAAVGLAGATATVGVTTSGVGLTLELAVESSQTAVGYSELVLTVDIADVGRMPGNPLDFHDVNPRITGPLPHPVTIVGPHGGPVAVSSARGHGLTIHGPRRSP